MRDWFLKNPLLRQQCFVASWRDRCEGRGLLEAFRRGEEWAKQELSNMKMLEFYASLFSLPEYGSGEGEAGLFD